MKVSRMTRPAIFLDRDGVLVEEIFRPETGEWDAPWIAAEVELIRGAAPAARRLADAGFALVLISTRLAMPRARLVCGTCGSRTSALSRCWQEKASSWTAY